MWFKFPAGAESIVVERQNFVSEARDEKGHGYFRAPAHFAARILSIPGFSHVGDPTEGGIADLPRENPLAEQTIQSLMDTLGAKEIEIRGLREDLISAQAEIKALMDKNAILAKDLASAQRDLDDIDEKLKLGELIEAPVPKTSAKGK